MIRLRRRTVGGGLVSGAMVVTSLVLSVPLAAADDGVVVTETGEALAAAGELVADPALLAETGDGYVATTVGIEVELPVDPADPLTIAGAAGELGIELPQVAGLDEGVVDESGAVVYESDSAPVSLAAQATDDGGLQVLVVIDGPDAPTEYRFELTVPPGALLRSTDDGGAEVVRPDGVAVSHIAPPWAVDADGVAVSTSYRIEGDTLVQLVDHVDAAYPVVADPNIGNCDWYQGACTVYFSTIETRRIAEGTIGFSALAAACTLAAGPYGGAACLAGGAYLVLGAQNARAQNKCLKVRVYAWGLPPVAGSYTKGTCST